VALCYLHELKNIKGAESDPSLGSLFTRKKLPNMSVIKK
jgi:hypothetical protein